MKKTSGILILSFLLFACQQNTSLSFKDEAGHRIEEERYGDGSLKAKTLYMNEDGTDYQYTSYYQDGTLMDSMFFMNNQLEGERVYFDQTAGLKHFEFYSNGILEGVNHAIYENGITSYSGYRKSGAKVGVWQFFYPDGRPITYEFYDSSGRIRYLRKYDENGNYQHADGKVIIAANISKQEVSINDTVYINLLAAVPPGVNSSFILISAYPGQTPDTLYQQDLELPHIKIPLTFSNRGVFDVETHVFLKDNQTGLVEEDNKAFKLKVI